MVLTDSHRKQIIMNVNDIINEAGVTAECISSVAEMTGGESQADY